MTDHLTPEQVQVMRDRADDWLATLERAGFSAETRARKIALSVGLLADALHAMTVHLDALADVVRDYEEDCSCIPPDMGVTEAVEALRSHLRAIAEITGGD